MLRVFLVRSRPPWSMFPHADPALPCASGRAQNLALFCACWAVPFLSCLIAISLDRLNFENSQINLTFHGKNLGPRFPVFFLRKVIRWPLLWISGEILTGFPPHLGMVHVSGCFKSCKLWPQPLLWLLNNCRAGCFKKSADLYAR